MSDLVGNPEDRFSHVAAHIKLGFKGVYMSCTCYPDDFSCRYLPCVCLFV